MNLPTTLTGITIIGSTLHWDIYPQLNIVKIPLKKLFSLVLTIQFFYCFKQKAKSVKTDLAFLMKSICLAYCLICILLCVIVMN